MDSSHTPRRWLLVAALLTVLSAAAAFRFYRLHELPVGLHYDEAANGILAGEIARGLKTPLFIPSYTGKEVLFFYWAALWMKALGVTTFTLRLAAATLGVTTVGATVWALYELLHDFPDRVWIALTAAALLAVSFWHVLLSRYGFRAIAQPLLQAVTVAALWHGIRLTPLQPRLPEQVAWHLLAGLFCGLTAYTYLAARAFPIPLAAAIGTLILVDRRHRRGRLTQALIFVGTATLALAPLAYYWMTHPGSFTTRARQVAANSWADAWRGVLACLQMLFLKGDPYIRFNLPERPLFHPVVAALFLLGVGTAIWRLRQSIGKSGSPRQLAATVFLLVLLPVMLLPSALATDEITPSNLRAVGLLPFVYAFPALGVATLAALLRRLGHFGARVVPFVYPAACILILALGGARTASAYSAWASSPALYYAADGDLADVADYLNRSDLSSTTPYVASQHYRHPTVAFLADAYPEVRWLVSGKSVVFPPSGEALLLFPRSASQDLDWVHSVLPQRALAAAPPGPDGEPAFHAYRTARAEAPRPSQRRSTNLGQAVELMGHSILNQPYSGETVDVAIWWRVTAPADQPDYHAIVRLADRWGSIWGESQPVHYPSEQWEVGELIIDHISVPIAPGAPPGDYLLQFALYSPGADIRLPVLDDVGAYAGLHVELPVAIRPARAPVSVDDLGLDRQLDAVIDNLILLGIRLDTTTTRPGEPLYLTLFWKAAEPPLPPHELRLQLGDTILHQGDPVHDTYPFSAWKAGEVIADRYDARVPLDVVPGEHPLILRIGGERGRKVSLAKIVVQATDRNFEVPPLGNTLGMTLGDSVELVGYDLSSDSVVPGETLPLTLTWRAQTEMRTDYTVFVHLLAPDGSMTGQQDRQPMGGRYPTTLWAAGEVVTDVYEIPIDPAAPPGKHRIEVGMYVAETGTRLPVPGQDENAVTLQGVYVTE